MPEKSMGLSVGPPVATDQRSAVEGRIPGRERRLSIIFDISRILVTEGDQESTLSRALHSLIQGLDAADAGSIWLYEPSQGILAATGALGYDLEILKKIRLSPGEAIAGRVCETGQALLCLTPEDTAAAMANMTTLNSDLFAAATAGIREPLSAIGVPLIADQHPIGVLVLLSLRQRKGFTDADMDFLQRVADLLTLAIENMQLRDELHAAQALGEANRLKAELISTLAHEMRTPADLDQGLLNSPAPGRGELSARKPSANSCRSSTKNATRLRPSSTICSSLPSLTPACSSSNSNQCCFPVWSRS